jgi:hypothetical protein
MQYHHALLALVAVVPLTAVSTGRPALLQDTGPFATPESPLVISDSGVAVQTLDDLLAEFERIAGQHVVANAHTREALRATNVGLVAGVSVPPDEVYSFVESLLAHHGFFVGRLRSGNPRLLSVRSSSGRGTWPVDEWMTVPVEEIDDYADHPALLVETVVDVAPMDSRQIVNSLRQLVHGNHQGMVAVSGSSLILRGTGSEVARTASMLELARAHHVAEEARRKAEQALAAEAARKAAPSEPR